MGHGFAGFELAATNHCTQLFQSFRPIGGVFAHDKALYFQAAHQNQGGIGHGNGLAVVASDHAAHRNAAELVHAQHDRVQHHAAHVFEVAVDAIGASVFQGLGQRQIVAVLFVIDASVKAQLFHHVIAFVLPASKTHHAATTGFGQGAKGAADCATGCTDGHGLTRFGVDDAHQAVPCGDTWHTDSTQEVADRHMGGIDLAKHGRHIGVHHAVGLPSAHAHHLVAHRKFGMTAFNHLTHSACDHDRVQGLWRGIAFTVIHAATHIGVKTHVLVLDQHLPVLQSGRVQGE